jgi:hypothetical protein
MMPNSRASTRAQCNDRRTVTPWSMSPHHESEGTVRGTSVSQALGGVSAGRAARRLVEEGRATLRRRTRDEAPDQLGHVVLSFRTIPLRWQFSGNARCDVGGPEAGQLDRDASSFEPKMLQPVRRRASSSSDWDTEDADLDLRSVRTGAARTDCAARVVHSPVRQPRGWGRQQGGDVN